MDERTKLCPINGLSVIVVDQDKHHANSARTMLCQVNFQATAYTSPIEALHFLEGHAQEVDVAFVALHMEEIHGFQFLDIVIEAHKDIQVIMMSKEATLDTMRRCVELGARFLVNKPVDANTIHNIWQHLDIKNPGMDNIVHLLQGNEETQGASHQKHNNTNKTKKGYICWTYLHGKFLRALEILGEGACPRNIEIIMNINGVNRKHIASHMQKFRKRMELGKQKNVPLDATKCIKRSSTFKSTKSCRKGPNTSLINPDIQQVGITTDQDMLDEQARSLYVSSAYTAMQRSIQLGIMYDESQHVDVLSSDEAAKYAILITEDEAALHHNTKIGDGRSDAKSEYSDIRSVAKNLYHRLVQMKSYR